MTSCYSLQNITFGYGQTPILQVDALDIAAGELVFVIGESGIGKSTFLEGIGLMSSTVMPLSPEARFAIMGEERDIPAAWRDQSPLLHEIRRGTFSFIFQNTNLLSNLNIRENVLMASMNEEGWDEDRFQSLLAKLDLEAAIADRLPGHISGGQRQRVAFIRAMMTSFSILLADEPTGNLDPENSKLLFSALQQDLKTQGKTAVIVSHHLELAHAFADRILLISRAEGSEISTLTEQTVAP